MNISYAILILGEQSASSRNIIISQDRVLLQTVAAELFPRIFNKRGNQDQMEAAQGEGVAAPPPPRPRVKATLNLGPETYSVNAGSKGTISEQLASMKEESMGILKEFITKHNVPNDVPDEPLEASSEDEDEDELAPVESSKKRK